MKVEPISKEEASNSNFNLLKPGTYPFEVLEAIDYKSERTGNQMIRLNLLIHLPGGGTRRLYDYLVNQMPHKLRHIAEVCGAVASYEAGNLEPHELEGKSGYVKIGIQKSKNPEYPDDKNTVNDYVEEGVGTSDDRARSLGGPSWGRKPATDLDDAIPF